MAVHRRVLTVADFDASLVKTFDHRIQRMTFAYLTDLSANRSSYSAYPTACNSQQTRCLINQIFRASLESIICERHSRRNC